LKPLPAADENIADRMTRASFSPVTPNKALPQKVPDNLKRQIKPIRKDTTLL
jgi:hypothetical protein